MEGERYLEIHGWREMEGETSKECKKIDGWREF
jgi:hypothetical protein